MTLRSRLTNEFGNANPNTFRLPSGRSNRLPASGLQEGGFRPRHELADWIREVRKACGPIKLIENAQQVGFLQGHSGRSGTVHLQKPLLHFVESSGHSLKDLCAAVRGQAQTPQASLHLLELLGDVQLRVRRTLGVIYWVPISLSTRL